MAKKTKYTPFDWTGTSPLAEQRTPYSLPVTTKSSSAPVVSYAGVEPSQPTQRCPDGAPSDDYFTGGPVQYRDSNSRHASPSASTSAEAGPNAGLELQKGVRNLPQASSRTAPLSALAETFRPSSIITTQSSLASAPAGEMATASISGKNLSSQSSTRSPPNSTSSSSPVTLSRRSSNTPLDLRKPLQSPPVPGKVFYLPDARHCEGSIIFTQKQQPGFFMHPVLAVQVQGNIMSFYTITKKPPHAIEDLQMAIRIGSGSRDAGWNVLKLMPGSDHMSQDSWINLEQCFYIEVKYVDKWYVDVRVDPAELAKIAARVTQLEADQNRFIYKPLPRNLDHVLTGMVLMLPNGHKSSTLGAPILVVENKYPPIGGGSPQISFLRIKRFQDNTFFNPACTRPPRGSPDMCLELSRTNKIGHDGTPVLVLQPGSPEMRERSYVEVEPYLQKEQTKKFKTWCWPPVQISVASMEMLREYIMEVARPKHRAETMHQPVNQVYHRDVDQPRQLNAPPNVCQSGELVQRPHESVHPTCFAPHHKHISSASSQGHGVIQPSSLSMSQAPTTLAFHPGYYVSSRGTHVVPKPKAGKRRNN